MQDMYIGSFLNEAPLLCPPNSTHPYIKGDPQRNPNLENSPYTNKDNLSTQGSDHEVFVKGRVLFLGTLLLRIS